MMIHHAERLVVFIYTNTQNDSSTRKNYPSIILNLTSFATIFIIVWNSENLSFIP